MMKKRKSPISVKDKERPNGFCIYMPRQKKPFGVFTPSGVAYGLDGALYFKEVQMTKNEKHRQLEELRKMEAGEEIERFKMATTEEIEELMELCGVR